MAVHVKVIKVQHNGIVVDILGMNRLGFIRHRELSWDRRIDYSPPTPEIGTVLSAVLLEDKAGARYAHVSLRHMTNPWERIGEKYQVGQVVRGEVVNVRQFAVFVQIEPGVDATIYPKDIPLRKGQPTVDALSIGDQMQGIIIDLDIKGRRMIVGLVQQLQTLDMFPADRLPAQIEIFKDMLCPKELGEQVPPLAAIQGEHEPLLHRYRAPISRSERLLVIDDDEIDLRNICEHLRKHIEIDVDGVRSGREALDKVKTGTHYGLAIIDMSLKEDNGIRVAEQLLDEKPDLAIIFTSANPLAEGEIDSIDGRTPPFVLKRHDSFDEIDERVDDIYRGYWEIVPAADTTPDTEPGSLIRQLEISALARRPIVEILNDMLSILRQETRVSYTMVLEIESLKQQASILVANPRLDSNIYQYSLDGLYYSPVRQVVEEKETFYANNIDQRNDRRFQHFFPLLPFRTCLGIPLNIPDMVTRFALFVFDERRSRLTQKIIDQVTLTGNLVQIALERALLLDIMRRYEQRYSLGQLLGSLVHEFKTKLDGLEGSAQTVAGMLQSCGDGSRIDSSTLLVEIREEVDKILGIRKDFSELVDAYSRIVQGNLEEVNVNIVVGKIKRQFLKMAGEANIDIHLDLQPDLPSTRAISSRLEQIVANLVLNAIQQIQKQNRWMEQIASEAGQRHSLLRSGLVVIQTRLKHTDTPYPIQIAVLDTGPGIHRHQQEQIFLLDTSTRKTGHGLGLYISRNMVETMGGRLRLADSIIFVGSVFVVELPQYLVYTQGG